MHDVSVRVNKMRAAVQSIRNKRFAHAYCSHFKTKLRTSHIEIVRVQELPVHAQFPRLLFFLRASAKGKE